MTLGRNLADIGVTGTAGAQEINERAGYPLSPPGTQWKRFDILHMKTFDDGDPLLLLPQLIGGSV
jgi:hypothetical protein